MTDEDWSEFGTIWHYYQHIAVKQKDSRFPDDTIKYDIFGENCILNEMSRKFVPMGQFTIKRSLFCQWRSSFQT